jgi:hypothetical protein
VRRAIVVALLILAAAPALAEESLEALRRRGVAHMTGTVEGRMYVERARPTAPDEPLVGVGVLVVPRSEELLDRLERMKRESRESMRAFREAAPGVRAALDAYETQLWRAGYPDAAVRAATDATGAFRVTLPAGSWLLAAQRSVFLPVQAPRDSAAPTASALDPLARYSTMPFQHFLPTARLTGFDAVTVWLRELTVAAGETVALELHDRGIWLSGVAEETGVPRRVRFAPGIKR